MKYVINHFPVLFIISIYPSPPDEVYYILKCVVENKYNEVVPGLYFLN